MMITPNQLFDRLWTKYTTLQIIDDPELELLDVWTQMKEEQFGGKQLMEIANPTILKIINEKL